jgi:hypothetical protein
MVVYRMAERVPPVPASTGVNTEDAVVTKPVDMTVRWEQRLALIREAVDEIGFKQTAFDLDVSPSLLSHALNGRERHNVPAKWLLYLELKSKRDDLAAFAARERGLDVVPRRVLTPEEQIAGLERALGELFGPELRALIFARAYGVK